MSYSPADAVEERRTVVSVPCRDLAVVFPQVRIDAIVVLMAASLVLRLILSACLPLTADEAYAVAVSRSHSLSYYDHPPMMFALARAMADLAGREIPFLMRLPFVAMGTASMWLLYDITRRAFGGRAALWAAAAFGLSPFFLTFGQVLIVPDGPLDFGLLLCFWLIQPRLAQIESSGWRWPAAGLALGFALLSKYQAGLFAAAACVALLLHPRWRAEYRHWAVWAAMAIAALCFSPVILWNAQHHWVSFAFQVGRSYQKTDVASHVMGLMSVLAGQVLYLLPFTWAGAHRAIVRALKGQGGELDWLLANLAIWQIAIFDVIALFGHHSLAHWAMSGFLFALPLLGKARAEVAASGVRWRLGVAAITVPLLILAISVQGVSGGLSAFGRQLPDLGRFNLPWSALQTAIADDGLPVVASDWVTAGQVSAAMGPGHALTVASDPHHFQYMSVLRPGTVAYFVTSTPGAGTINPPPAYRAVGQARQVVQHHGTQDSFCIWVTRVVVQRP